MNPSTAGEPFDCEKFYDKWIQLGGTFVGSFQIQGTINGTDWETLVEKSAPEIVEVDVAFTYVRVRCVSYVGGTPTATFVGRQTI